MTSPLLKSLKIHCIHVLLCYEYPEALGLQHYFEASTVTHTYLAPHCMKHISQTKTDYKVPSPTSKSISQLSIGWEGNAAFHIMSSELPYLCTVYALL